eukprot:1146199-Pelagomonas_calceolata.AAC.6
MAHNSARHQDGGTKFCKAMYSFSLKIPNDQLDSRVPPLKICSSPQQPGARPGKEDAAFSRNIMTIIMCAYFIVRSLLTCHF